MRLVSIIVLAVAAILGVSFALLNSDLVMVRYYVGAHSVPLSVLMLIVWVFGITIGLLVSFPKIIRLRMEVRRLRREHD